MSQKTTSPHLRPEATQGVPFLIVDAFAEGPYSGNQAAVCLIQESVEASWMQDVAAEMGFSETAFVNVGKRARKQEVGSNPVGPNPIDVSGPLSLRWFSPVTEMNLCGHATLGAAHALWELGYRPIDMPILFDTKSGTLRATCLTTAATTDPPVGSNGSATATSTSTLDSTVVTIELPAMKVRRTTPPETLESSLALSPGHTDEAWTCFTATPLPAPRPGVTRAGIGQSEAPFDLVIALEHADVLRRVEPDIDALASLNVRACILTAPGEDAENTGTDYVLRVFAPRIGIPEDPATGSAHCSLGPLWSDRLGKSELRARQLSPRGASFVVGVNRDRVAVSGRAISVARGVWLV